jgi:SET domain-containing protein
MKKIEIVKSKIHGKGLIAKEQIKKGDFAGFIKGPVKYKVNTTLKDSLQNPDWVGFAKNWWTDPLPPFKYLNHSCDPTCGITGTRTLRALRDIAIGEEITIDYSTTEVDPHWFLHCNCRSKDCRKEIRSIQKISPKIFKKYSPLIPTAIKNFYLKEMYIEEI